VYVSLKQRLLYLQCESVSVRSPVLAMALHEPVAGSVTQIEPTGIEFPYATVHEAIIDGWRVISFPSPKEPATTDEGLTVLGYEFILEKMEAFE
jgi:predicted metalloenzyme YecM